MSQNAKSEPSTNPKHHDWRHRDMPHEWALRLENARKFWQCEKCTAEGRNTERFKFYFSSEKPGDDDLIWVSGNLSYTCEELQIAQIHEE